MNQLIAFNIGEATNLGEKSVSAQYPTISVLISIILKNGLTIIGILLLGLLIFGGVTYIMGAGSDDAKKAQQAKSAITNALIGFAVVFLAFFIIQIIEVITGLDILNPTI